MEKTHKIIINSYTKEYIYITMEQAKYVFNQIQNEKIVKIVNEKTFFLRKLNPSKIDLTPLDDFEKIIYNLKDKELIYKIEKFIEERKENKLYTSVNILNEFIQKNGK